VRVGGPRHPSRRPCYRPYPAARLPGAADRWLNPLEIVVPKSENGLQAVDNQLSSNRNCGKLGFDPDDFSVASPTLRSTSTENKALAHANPTSQSQQGEQLPRGLNYAAGSSVLAKKKGTVEIGDTSPSELVDPRHCEPRLLGQMGKQFARHEIPPMRIITEIASRISRII
jgi:hypothetical protein